MSHRRACRTAPGWALIAAVLAIVGIVGCGAGSRSTASQPKPSATSTASPPAAWSTAATSTSDARRGGSRLPVEKGQSAAPGSPSSARLAVARQFSDAYMAYQVAWLSPQVRATIAQTCTPAFAWFLLAHPVVLPPALVSHPSDLELFRVASVNPAAGGRVSVSYVSEQLRSDTGSFLLTFAWRAGRWLISRLDA